MLPTPESQACHGVCCVACIHMNCQVPAMYGYLLAYGTLKVALPETNRKRVPTPKNTQVTRKPSLGSPKSQQHHQLGLVWWECWMARKIVALHLVPFKKPPKMNGVLCTHEPRGRNSMAHGPHGPMGFGAMPIGERPGGFVREPRCPKRSDRMGPFGCSVLVHCLVMDPKG